MFSPSNASLFPFALTPKETRSSKNRNSAPHLSVSSRRTPWTNYANYRLNHNGGPKSPTSFVGYGIASWISSKRKVLLRYRVIRHCKSGPSPGLSPPHPSEYPTSGHARQVQRNPPCHGKTATFHGQIPTWKTATYKKHTAYRKKPRFHFYKNARTCRMPSMKSPRKSRTP